LKILVLIPARGGSKRLPKKNIRHLGGVPLIEWSIDIAKLIPEVCDILVSTDSAETLDIAQELGAYVPWIRPKELSGDNSSSVDVALHALDWYEFKHGTVDGLLMLQPTSPFRSLETIRKGIEMYLKKDVDSILGVSPTHAHPGWTFKIKGNALSPFLGKHELNTRSQDLDPAYVINGSFYLISPCTLRKEKSFFTKGSLPLVIKSNIESLDIDTEQDWQYAEYCLNILKLMESKHTTC
jgi:CMP-N,N'-diacetyllegionaminic acid synthase